MIYRNELHTPIFRLKSGQLKEEWGELGEYLFKEMASWEKELKVNKLRI
jgi:hypothetical protein